MNLENNQPLWTHPEWIAIAKNPENFLLYGESHRTLKKIFGSSHCEFPKLNPGNRKPYGPYGLSTTATKVIMDSGLVNDDGSIKLDQLMDSVKTHRILKTRRCGKHCLQELEAYLK